MSEFVSVNSVLLASALAELVDKDVAELYVQSPRSSSRQDVSRKFLEGVVIEFEDAELFCDHNVGICACGPLAILEDLKLALDAKQRCLICGGDGFVYNEAKGALAASIAAKRDSFYDGDEAWYEKCPMCSGAGVVAA